MSGTCISCGSERRRQLVRTTKPAGNPILNGIDFVEVAPSQKILTVSFIHALNAVAGAPVLGPLNFRIEGGKRIKPRYLTQIKSRPPSFVLFGTRVDLLPESYRRYLVNSLRKEFDFGAVPVRLTMRAPKNPFDQDKN